MRKLGLDDWIDGMRRQKEARQKEWKLVQWEVTDNCTSEKRALV